MTEITDSPAEAEIDGAILEMADEPMSLLEESVPEDQMTEEDAFLMLVDSEEEEVGVRADLDPKDEPIGDGVKDPKPQEEAEPEKSEEKGEEEEKEEAETEKEPDEEIDADELEQAFSALKRDGLKKDILEKMTNKEVLDLGLKRSKVQADTDNAYRELAELKKQTDTADENQAESNAAAEPADQPAKVNLKEAVEPFSEIFGEEAAEALVQAQQAALGTVEPQLENLQSQINGAINMVEGILLKAARNDLADRFPLMSNDDSYGRIRTRMDSLVKTGEYQDINTLMTDAARIEYSDEGAAAQAELKLEKLRQKASGQMTTAQTTAAATASLSEDEREAALLEALESGMPVGEAGKLYGASQPPK